LRVGKPWLSTDSVYTGIRITQNKENILFVTSPGEAIQEISHQIRSDALRNGFQKSFFFGYSNNHLGYFTTEREYEEGGYESLMSFFGIQTGHLIREKMNQAMSLVKPK
jgi:hypothetical protein